MLGAVIGLSACKVETSTEKIPAAEGSGKNAVNIRVEPMNREEIKEAAGKVIDKTADVAGEVKDAATTLNQNMRDARLKVTTETQHTVAPATDVTVTTETVTVQ